MVNRAAGGNTLGLYKFQLMEAIIENSAFAVTPYKCTVPGNRTDI